MNHIINIFTKKPLELDDFKQTKKSLESSGSSVFDQIRAERGDSLPAHFEQCMSQSQPQPYMHGDPHNVKYHARDLFFNRPSAVPSLINGHSVRHDKNGVIQLGAMCEYGLDEPFPWMDQKYGISLNFLKSLPNNTEIHITTRSDLVATDAYLDELRRLRPKIRMLYVSEDDGVNRVLEPGAPSYQRRLAACVLLNQWNCPAEIVRHDIPAKYRRLLNKSA